MKRKRKKTLSRASLSAPLPRGLQAAIEKKAKLLCRGIGDRTLYKNGRKFIIRREEEQAKLIDNVSQAFWQARFAHAIKKFPKAGRGRPRLLEPLAFVQQMAFAYFQFIGEIPAPKGNNRYNKSWQPKFQRWLNDWCDCFRIERFNPDLIENAVRAAHERVPAFLMLQPIVMKSACDKPPKTSAESVSLLKDHMNGKKKLPKRKKNVSAIYPP